MEFVLQQNLWQGMAPVRIQLPDEWDVEYHGMAADDQPPLSREQIRERINRPYGFPPLRELAKGKNQAAIVFDDISRGTPTQILAEIVLEELHGAGMQKDQIRFICALGTHGAHNREDFVCKLGEYIVKNYRVFNHNCYENCVSIGRDHTGFDVCINREFMACDLKIGLGALLPHVLNGFGGGGKLLFPGLASIETVAHNHTIGYEFRKKYKLLPGEGMGDLRMKGMRENVEEMTRMVGDFFKIDCLFNSRMEIVDVYAGDAVEEYYAGVPAARKLYATPRAKDKQIVIMNANARANEATVAMSMGVLGVAETGGDLVIINHTRRGQVCHYLFGTFGDCAPGRMYSGSKPVRKGLERILCWMPYAMPGDKPFFGNPSIQVYVDTWEEALALLTEKYGPGTKVSVIADGTLEFFEPEPDPVYARAEK